MHDRMTSPARAHAPGKIILLGEHAVVYGRPAIAAPVTHVRATATVMPGRPNVGVVINAEDLGRRYLLDAAPKNDALAHTINTVLSYLDVEQPDAQITVASTIPIASGLGSGAAVATVIVRALAAHLDHSLTDAEVSQLVYETEKLLHGSPSGIDNTVVAYARPIWFVKREDPAPITVGGEFTFLIANTGISSPTKITVGDVRDYWKAAPDRYESLFDQIGDIVIDGRQALEQGDVEMLGDLMVANQDVLRDIDVSSKEIEQLVRAALDAGAYGAKLSGGGRGGNVVVLAAQERLPIVETALYRAGAVNVLRSTLSPIEHT